MRSSAAFALVLSLASMLLALAVVAPPAAALLDFRRSGIDVGTGGVKGVALADVNGDKRLDLITRNVFAYVTVSLGRGDGTFKQPRSYRDDAEMLAVADLTRDGRADVVTLDVSSAWVRLGRRDGTLGARRGYAVGRWCAGLAVADVTRDGRADLVVTDRRARRVCVLAGRGDGTFRAPVKYAAGADPRGVAVGDVTGDGRPDLVIANFASARVSVVPGARKGFGARREYRLSTTIQGMQPRSVALGDVDRDRRLDVLVVTDFYAPGAWVLRGAGGGRLVPGAQPLPFSPTNAAALGDVTGDGALDVVAMGGRSLVVVPGVGSGEFRSPQRYEWALGLAGQGAALGGVAVGDLNGDRRRDVVAVSAYYGDYPSVDVFLNEGLGPTLAISPFWPEPVPIVSQLTAADMDGDQKLDLVVAVDGAVVNYGAGDGTVAERLAAAPADAAYDVVTAHLDADASLDLAYTTLDGVDVALADGARSFAAPALYVNGTTAARLAAGDLTGDGRPDLAVVSWNYGNELSVRANDGAGHFGPETVSPTLGQPADVEIADMDGDGMRDVVVVSQAGWVSIFPGNGDGTLGMRRDYAAGEGPTQLRLADLDGDGHLDVVTDAISVLLGNGDGTLSPACTMPGGASIEVADMNADGVPDIVTTRLRWDTRADVFEVLLGAGDGTFVARDIAGKGGLLAAGDFDGNGKQDLVSAGQTGGLALYLGTGDYAPVPPLVLGDGESWVNDPSLTMTLAARLARTMRMRIDGGAWSDPAPFAWSKDLSLPEQGLHQVDVVYTTPVGDEKAVSGSVGVDTVAPVAVADWPATGRRGGTATLQYRVDDAVPGSPTARVRVVILRQDTLVQTLELGQQPVNELRQSSFRCSLPAGRYTFLLRVNDLAGNYQSADAGNTLTVR